LYTADVYEGSPIAVTSFLSVVSKGAIAFIFITALYKVFRPLEDIWYNMLVILSISTMLIGNLFALRQQQFKRFLAFSSIAQVGFILVGISSGALEGVSAVVYFVLIYVFSNLAAFGVAELISNQTGKETIDDYKGLYTTNPFLSWILALALFHWQASRQQQGFWKIISYNSRRIKSLLLVYHRSCPEYDDFFILLFKSGTSCFHGKG
jgi:NADH-quinone oxidoreductase subunit N